MADSSSGNPRSTKGLSMTAVDQSTAGAAAASREQLVISRQSSHCKRLRGVKWSSEVFDKIIKSMICNPEDYELIGKSGPQISVVGEYTIDYRKEENGKKTFIRLRMIVIDSSDDASKKDVAAICAEVELETQLGLWDRFKEFCTRKKEPRVWNAVNRAASVAPLVYFACLLDGLFQNETVRSSFNYKALPVEADRALAAEIESRARLEGAVHQLGPETGRKEKTDEPVIKVDDSCKQQQRPPVDDKCNN